VKLEEALSCLDLMDSLELFRPHWEESESRFPDGAPSFLNPAQFTASRAFADLPPELDGLLIEASRRVLGHPALLHLSWHVYRLLFEHRDYPRTCIARWPPLEASMSPLSGLFYLLIALGAVPLTREVHRARGVPETITRDTCRDIHENIGYYRAKHDGAWGIYLPYLHWIRHYGSGALYTLGRLEYMVGSFYGKLRVYRHRRTGEVLALAEDGLRFDGQGHARAGQAEGASADGWTSRLAVADDLVIGNPISPTGVAVPREVRLPVSDWQQALAPGDPILDVHIAAGGGMTPQRCADSMRQALEFYPRYFPEKPFAGFACVSWVLNPDLADFYTPQSNMALWQREVHLFPYPSDGRSGLFYVFGEDEVDVKTAPRRTSLQRAMLGHLSAGNPLRAGGMFMLKEDFRFFGSEYYRSHWPPSALGPAG
jgi:hypothetical protein